MRYRIKITTFKNKRKEFRAQKKVLFGWADLDYCGVVYHSITCRTDTRTEALNRIYLHYEGNTAEHTIEFEYITT
jgi:hypothetical protein